MKLAITFLTSMLLLAPLEAIHAETKSTGCEGKRQKIEQQIDYARAHGNAHRVAGLQKALSEVNANCTNAGLRAERESDIRKKERKVEERRQELAEARADGRENKILNKQKKLKDALDELTEARGMLDK